MAWLRRKRTVRQRMARRSQDARKAVAQLDQPWARSWFARLLRELLLQFVLEPLIEYYTRRRATGREKLAQLDGPCILVANHTSHIDTPIILGALPRKLRRRTAVGAAADYFYRNRLVAALVSLFFNTVPVQRKGGGMSEGATDHLDRLLGQGWNLLLYPEGTRENERRPRRLRRGAAVLADRHRLPVVPIRLSGTREAMPPGTAWPKRLMRGMLLRRHRVEICFGEPIPPDEDPRTMIERVQRFFEGLDPNSELSAPPAADRELASTR
jgi:1-acyl-sn-glycerol-3-phosphate acyltransferase